MQITKDSLSYRLNLALRELSMSQSELARKIGAKPQAIQYICSHNVQKSIYTQAISKALEVSYEWLAAGVGDMVYENIMRTEDITSYKVPILDDEQLSEFMKNDFDILCLRTQDFAISHREIPFTTIAYQISDQSMEPIFNQHSTVFIDYQASSENGDYVLAYIQNIHQYLIRKLHRQQGAFILEPCNTYLYKEITLGKNDLIIGPVIQALQVFK